MGATNCFQNKVFSLIPGYKWFPYSKFPFLYGPAAVQLAGKVSLHAGSGIVGRLEAVVVLFLVLKQFQTFCIIKCGDFLREEGGKREECYH